MKKIVLAFATILLLGAFAVAQSAQDTDPAASPNAMQGTTMSSQPPTTEKALDQATDGTLDTSLTPSAQATGDPNKDHGIDKLDDLYRESRDPNSSDWLNPNVTLSSPGDVAGN